MSNVPGTVRALLIIGIISVITGCSIKREQIDRAITLCEPNGGLARISLDAGDVLYHCENGATFRE